MKKFTDKNTDTWKPLTLSHPSTGDQKTPDPGSSRGIRQHRKHRSRVRRLLVGAIPYFLFLTALVFISTGIFQYIEQESILAVFLTQRDHIITADEWKSGSLSNPQPTSGSTLKKDHAVVRPGERLLVPFYYVGEEFGKLNFSRIGLEVAVLQGDNEAQFKLGAGHFTGSYFPGQGGNIVLASHRTGYFRKLEYVKTGDEIVFTTTYGKFTYLVDQIRIIDGKDNSVAAASSVEKLTLYTCYPFRYIGNAPKRYVVICSLKESEINS